MMYRLRNNMFERLRTIIVEFCGWLRAIEAFLLCDLQVLRVTDIVGFLIPRKCSGSGILKWDKSL